MMRNLKQYVVTIKEIFDPTKERAITDFPVQKLKIEILAENVNQAIDRTWSVVNLSEADYEIISVADSAYCLRRQVRPDFDD